MLDRVQYLKNYYDFLGKEILRLRTEREKSLEQQDFLFKELERYSKLTNLIKLVSDHYSSQYLVNLKQFVDAGLAAIFHDRDYLIEVEIDEKRGQKEVQFYLIDGELRTELSNIGSGVKCVVAFLVQIFVLEKFDRKTVFLDESFTEIATDYVESLFGFIKRLTTELGFDIMLITHDERFLPYFENLYEVRDGTIIKKEIA